MTAAEKNIVESYSGLFDGLGTLSKLELLEYLAKSLKKDRTTKEREFFRSFGAFGSTKPAEELAKEVKESRKFKEKDIDF